MTETLARPVPAARETCPKCGFARGETAETCAACGVIFAKVGESASERRRTAAATRVEPRPQPLVARLLATTESRLFAGGLVAAAAAYAIPLTRALLSPLVTLLHEFGHAATAWLLGCPAVPAFDMVYGGGITFNQGFELPLAGFIGAGWLALAWWMRGRPWAIAAVASCAACWLFAVSSEVRRDVIITSMGHGGELVLAGAFLYLALAGVGWRRPDIERPFGAFAGFFVLIHFVAFGSRLRSDPGFLEWYREGKGGALMNDLESISVDLHIWTGSSTTIEDLAGWLVAASFGTIAAAVALHAFRSRVSAFAVWLFEPSGNRTA